MRCKPGDLAFIVQDAFPENVGRVVRVVRQADWPDGFPEWTVEAVGEPFRVLLVPANMPAYERDGDCYDAHLRPITGVPVDDEQLEEMVA